MQSGLPRIPCSAFDHGRLHDLEHSGDLDLAYAAARAHNRGMLEFRSVDRRLLLIFDGVLDRFAGLRIGVIKQGAIWVPSWLRQMESAFEAFSSHEDRLRSLTLRPSDYVHRQIRFTPYPTEDIGWIIDQAGADLLMFSSDYPHVEGGRRPLERFEASLGCVGEDVRQLFYAENFRFLIRTAMAGH